MPRRAGMRCFRWPAHGTVDRARTTIHPNRPQPILYASSSPPITLCCPHPPANNWINGTIPDDLANLTRLRRLGLGTNFLSGTIGDWVGGLVGLEVLELGANSGVNPPDPVTGEELAGIVGTVPQGVAQLTKLVELNLQVRGAGG
jgi:hypothetical protein